jgi:hypothetical protein
MKPLRQHFDVWLKEKKVGRFFPRQSFITRLTDCGYFGGPVSSKDCFRYQCLAPKFHQQFEFYLRLL